MPARTLPVPVRAAGAICWRLAPGLPPGTLPAPDTIELLMVRSTRWGDWTWPKGKMSPGETGPAGAVREVLEETGLRVRLGLPLPPLRYRVEDGRPKQVDYWVGHCDRGTQPGDVDSEEIAELAWLPVEEALGRLRWPGEAAPVEHLLGLAAARRLESQALLVVRHAKAVSRADWAGTEAQRPLTGLGLRQVAGLSGLLACWSPQLFFTSPWLRCVQTVTEYADSEGLDLDPARWLSERGAAADPQAVKEELENLVDAGAPAALCTHRPVLPLIVAAVRGRGTGRARAALPRRDPWLRPAEVLVAHLRPGGGEVLAVERHRSSGRARTPLGLRAS